MKVSTIFNKRVGLGYSQYGFGVHEMGVSFDTFVELAGLRSYSDLPLEKVKVKVADPSKTADLANRLRN